LQGFDRQGLLDEVHFFVDDPSVNDDVRGIARHVEHLQALSYGFQTLVDFLAVHVGHDHVVRNRTTATTRRKARAIV
jgi:hypothetical protein